MTLLTSYCKDTDLGRLTNKCAIRSKQTTKSNSNFSLCLIGNHCVPKFSGCVAIILTSLWFSFFLISSLDTETTSTGLCAAMSWSTSSPSPTLFQRDDFHDMQCHYFSHSPFQLKLMPSITCKLSIKKLIFIRGFFCFLPIRDRWCQRAFI